MPRTTPGQSSAPHSPRPCSTPCRPLSGAIVASLASSPRPRHPASSGGRTRRRGCPGRHHPAGRTARRSRGRRCRRLLLLGVHHADLTAASGERDVLVLGAVDPVGALDTARPEAEGDLGAGLPVPLRPEVEPVVTAPGVTVRRRGRPARPAASRSAVSDGHRSARRPARVRSPRTPGRRRTPGAPARGGEVTVGSRAGPHEATGGAPTGGRGGARAGPHRRPAAGTRRRRPRAPRRRDDGRDHPSRTTVTHWPRLSAGAGFIVRRYTQHAPCVTDCPPGSPGQALLPARSPPPAG